MLTQDHRRDYIILAAYYATLLVSLASSFFPHVRLWGVNWWGYLPFYARFILLVIGGGAPLLVHYWRRNSKRHSEKISRQSYIASSTVGVGIAGLLFYVFRARMHFLGDGYTLLANLAKDLPTMKGRELGEELAHHWVKGVAENISTEPVLFSYQFISIAAGIVLVAATATLANHLVDRRRDAMLFSIGICTGGFMLLFFGYVENYSLFCLSVALFTLAGTLAATGKARSWIVIPPLALAIFFHTLGVTLLPAAVYLLMSGSRFAAQLKRLRTRSRIVISAVLVTAVGILFAYYYTTDYFFRFAILPPAPDRFTVDNYTLFSFDHLVDYANLILMLMPGLLVLLAAGSISALRKSLSVRKYRFLLILTLSSMGAVFIFDPKLGMPRDWDLFSFMGVPLTVLAYLLLLDVRKKPAVPGAAALAAILAVLSLGVRVTCQIVPDSSIEMMRTYISLDKDKTRTAQYVVANYLHEHGRDAKLEELNREWGDQTIQNQVLNGAKDMIAEGKLPEAMIALTSLSKANPGIMGAWENMGQCYYLLGKYDSALMMLDIADGLNPYHPEIQHDMGLVYLHLKKLNEADKYFTRASRLDTAFLEPLMGLSEVFSAQGRTEEYWAVCIKIVSRDDAPPGFMKRVLEYYLEEGQTADAREVLARARKKGLDSSYVQRLRQKFPQVNQMLRVN